MVTYSSTNPNVHCSTSWKSQHFTRITIKPDFHRKIAKVIYTPINLLKPCQSASVALLDARSTGDQEIVGSIPT